MELLAQSNSRLLGHKPKTAFHDNNLIPTVKGFKVLMLNFGLLGQLVVPTNYVTYLRMLNENVKLFAEVEPQTELLE